MNKQQAWVTVVLAGVVVAMAAWASGASAGEKAPTYVVYKLFLDYAIDGNTLEVYVQRRGEKFGIAVANAPTWNQVSHDVDVSGLKLADDTLQGEIKAVIHPDSWTPPDQRKAAAVLVVDVKVGGNEIKGRFEGKVGDNAVKGNVRGRVEPFDAAVLDNAYLELQIENAITYELEDWRQRVFVNLYRSEGKFTKGVLRTDSVEVPDGELGVQIDPTGIKLTPDQITGEFSLAVKGKPTIIVKLSGQVVGRQIGGTCTVQVGEKSHERRLRGDIHSPPPHSAR